MVLKSRAIGAAPALKKARSMRSPQSPSPRMRNIHDVVNNITVALQVSVLRNAPTPASASSPEVTP